MVNYGHECDRCQGLKEDGAPYERRRYECKPGWEYTAPMVRARLAWLDEEWEADRWRPRTAAEAAEDLARAPEREAFRKAVNGLCKDVFGSLEKAIPSPAASRTHARGRW